MFRNALLATALGAIILGGIGYLLAGKAGLVNGATWGVILGLVSAPFSSIPFKAEYWGDYAQRFGDWWIQKETEGDE